MPTYTTLPVRCLYRASVSTQTRQLVDGKHQYRFFQAADYRVVCTGFQRDFLTAAYYSVLTVEGNPGTPGDHLHLLGGAPRLIGGFTTQPDKTLAFAAFDDGMFLLCHCLFDQCLYYSHF